MRRNGLPEQITRQRDPDKTLLLVVHHSSMKDNVLNSNMYGVREVDSHFHASKKARKLCKSNLPANKRDIDAFFKPHIGVGQVPGGT